MKRFIIISAIISAFVALNSCEKHDWETTKLLHVDKAKKDDSHGHGAHADHDHDHAENKGNHGADSKDH